MATAVRTADIPGHVARVEGQSSRRKAKRQAKDFGASLSGKTFSELTGVEKDDLLKAIALELGLISPDP